MSLRLHLEHFESSFTMDTPAELQLPTVGAVPTNRTVLDLSGYDVSASVFSLTFFIKADTDIIGDASSVLYYVDKTKWSNSIGTMNPNNGKVSEGQYEDDDDMGHDFIKDLARQCFGTHLAANLFTNEGAMLDDISGKSLNVSIDINDKISAADISDGNIEGMLGEAGNKHLDDTFDGNNNITKLMFNSLFGSFPTRFADISNNYPYPGKEKGFYQLPFEAGDQIEFVLTLSPHPDTFTSIPTKPAGTTPDNRVYTCRLTLS